jgi:hypothetical protein
MVAPDHQDLQFRIVDPDVDDEGLWKSGDRRRKGLEAEDGYE